MDSTLPEDEEDENEKKDVKEKAKEINNDMFDMFSETWK